ncbi:MAG: TonB-dependent receptor [Calditrichia bacterium]
MKTSDLKIWILFLMFIFTYSLVAQSSSGTISGTIKDASSGEMLTGTNIYLKDTHMGTAAGSHGEFTISNIPPGAYMLMVNMLGYETIEKQLSIHAGEDLSFNFELNPVALNMGNVVVTATRSQELVTSVPVATEILGAKELQETNAQNVGQALESIGGALVKSYGPVGSLETISLRGSTDSQVLVLVDGQRLNDAQSGSVDLSQIPLDAVEKIEVVKGGHSALYGSDAVGGVINIITKSKARDKGLDASWHSTMGSFNTQIHDFSVGQGLGNLDYFVSYNRTQTNGDFEYFNDLQNKRMKMVNADNTSDDIFVKGGYLFPNQSRLSVFHQYHSGKQGSPGSIDFPNASARLNITGNHTSVSYKDLCFGPVALQMQGYLMQNDQSYTNPESYLGLEKNNYKNRALGASLQVFTDMNAAGLFSYGYEFRQDRLKSNYWINGVSQPFIGDHQRNVHSFFLQDDWKYGIDHAWKILAVPAIRLDRYPEEGVGSQYSPKIGVTLSRVTGWRGSIRGNIGRVFRAPTYNDLYWPEDAWTKGNPDLKPEKGISYDGGYIAQFGGLGYWSIEQTYFASRLDNLILWAPGPSGKWMPENVAKGFTRGVESKMSWSGFNGALNAQIGYTFMKSTDDGDDPATAGNYLIYRPRHKYDASLGFNYGMAAFNVYYHYVGKRFHDAANTIELDPYSLINLNLGINPRVMGVRWLLRFEVNNLANKDIQISKGSPVPGREFRVTLGIDGSFLK